MLQGKGHTVHSGINYGDLNLQVVSTSACLKSSVSALQPFKLLTNTSQ